MGDLIEQKREDLLSGINEHLVQTGDVSGYHPDHVRASVTRAREQLLDDGDTATT
jgi:LmbE family N-acetylglucosaminyl deacetylase